MFKFKFSAHNLYQLCVRLCFSCETYFYFLIFYLTTYPLCKAVQPQLLDDSLEPIKNYFNISPKMANIKKH